MKFDFGGAPKPQAPAPSAPPAPAKVEEVETPKQAEEEEKEALRVEARIDLAELDELERILVPPAETSVKFAKSEVKAVETLISDADKAAQKQQAGAVDAPKDEKQTPPSPQEQKSAPASAEPKSAAPQATTTPTTREAVDSLRESAKRVETQAAETARAELAKAEASLRQDIEKVLAKDLSSLSPEGLRERVVQLTLELKDRNRWEAIRLHEVISKTVEDVSRKYLAMMKEQEAAYEHLVRAEVANAAMEATTTTEERLSRSLQDRLQRQKQALGMEMELAIEQAKEEERQTADKERKARTGVIRDMERKLMELDEALKERDRSKIELSRTRRALLAALRFSRVVFLDRASSNEVEESLSELRLATAGDAVVSETLDALPHRVFASGVPSLHRLAQAFEKEVKRELLQASLIPENASLIQHALAKATTALMVTSKPSASPMPDDDSLDSRCARVQALLDKEDLVAAVGEVQAFPEKALKGASSAKDWLAQAQDRLKVEAAIRLLTARLESKQ